MIPNNDNETRKQKMYYFLQKEFSAFKRKYTNEPYFSHLEDVAEKCAFHDIKLGYEIGLAHDLFEDTKMTPHEFIEIICGFGYERPEAEFISNVCLELTNEYSHEKYPKLNRKERTDMEAFRLANVSPIAQSVKCCDIMSNCSDIVDKDYGFATHYLVEKENVVSKMKNINEFIQLRVESVLTKGLVELEGRKVLPRTSILYNRWNKKMNSKEKIDSKNESYT